MKTMHSQLLHCAIIGSALCALAIPATSYATLKYQPCDYVQDGLIVHLDGIRNVGTNKAHDSSATYWENLADPTNPAAITNNASSGWRDDGYYFAYNSTPSYARLISNASAMTSATFEFAIDANKSAQGLLGWGCTFFSGANDQRVCTVDNNGQIRFKADDWTGSSSYRPSISGWSWKQASFTLGSSGDGNFKSYDSGTFKESKSAGTTGENGIPATQWMVGSRIGQTDSGRQFTGVMRSFRIYNRVLTADEVAQNAAIDAARFDGVMPVTNAIIATSVAGAFGNEVPGIYAVDGSHTFTAPPSATVSGTTYALTGCTIERWEDGAWSSSVTCDGVFAVAVSESEKVRITWRWESTNATLGGYVTDGLVVWLDGIWNIGLGKPHNSHAAAWANLADPANPAAITANASSCWRNDGYYFCYTNNTSYARLAKDAPGMTRATFEMAFQGSLADQSAFDWGSYFVSVEANYGICGMDKNGKICLNKIGGSEGDYRVNFLWNWKQTSFTLGEVGSGGIKAYDEGVQKDSRSRPSIKVIPGARWYVGNYSNSQKYQAVGTMKAVRIYNRALSADEVAQNAVADEARFSSGTNGVEVTANVLGFAGREPAGFYTPNGWTFSASAATQTVNGIAYAAAGYTIETYDAATGTWSVSETSDSATTWPAPAKPFANRRLTWKWVPVSGIRRAADYDLEDYVQDGLVAWLDGIHNAGIDLPHDSAATTWADLSVRKSGVQLTTNDLSHWTDDGYYFCLGSGNERSYAYLKQTLSLGEVGTIEFASEVDLTKKNPTGADNYAGRFVSYVTGEGSGAFSDSCIRNQGDTQVEWNADNWSGTTWQNRVKTTPTWDGRHAAFVMAADSYTSFKAGVRDQSKTRAAVVEMPKLYWMIGNKYNESWIANQLTGTMKALRLYDRPLSDSEIAQNYKVDVARFDGALAVTNVLVAASDYNGSLAADAYEVYGTHTFVGANSAIDGSAPNRVKVWTLQNGAWTGPEVVNGGSYTYTAGTSPATVKIEFGKTNPFVIMVR